MHDDPISVRDEQHLEWFFSLGQTAFERSTTSGLCERAFLYSKAREYSVARVPVIGSHGEVIGHRSGLEARPTAETRNVGGYVPDDATLIRYAHVSATLKRIGCSSALVLELWYGDLGQRWAPNSPWGRAGALFHMTAKGRQLLAEASKGKDAAAIELSPTARMEVICAVQQAQPRRERAQALAYCAQQALALQHQARAAWHAVTRSAAAA